MPLFGRSQGSKSRRVSGRDREFNRYTLLGEYDSIYIALLKQRLYNDGLDPEDVEPYFRAHLNRGIELLQQRVRSVSDFIGLLPKPKPKSK